MILAEYTKPTPRLWNLSSHLYVIVISIFKLVRWIISFEIKVTAIVIYHHRYLFVTVWGDIFPPRPPEKIHFLLVGGWAAREQKQRVRPRRVRRKHQERHRHLQGTQGEKEQSKLFKVANVTNCCHYILHTHMKRQYTSQFRVAYCENLLKDRLWLKDHGGKMHFHKLIKL